MAGWSLLNDGCNLDFVVTPGKFKPEAFFVDLGPISEGGLVGVEANSDNTSSECVSNGFSNKLRCRFDHFLRGVLEEIYTKNYFRLITPMLGDGQQVNLQKLFVVVKQKGGYDAVSENSLWDLVAQESGLGVSVGSSVKLIYSKYLNTLDSWLKRAANNNVSDAVLSDIGAEFSRRLMELQTGVEGLLSEFSDKEDSDDKCRRLCFKRKLDYRDVQILCDTNKVKSIMTMDVDEGKKIQCGRHLDLDMPECRMNEPRAGNLCNNVNAMERLQEFHEDKISVNIKEDACLDHARKVSVDVPEVRNMCNSNEVYSTLGLSDGSKGRGSDDDDDDVLILDPSRVDKGSFGHKRKRESMWEILKWVTGIAKNPCDPSSGSIPERSKRKSHGNEETWKKVLLFREAVFLKRHAESSDERHSWQNQRMHPCLYDDQLGAAYNLRERLKYDKRPISGKSTCTDSSLQTQGDLERSPSPRIEFHCDKFPKMPIPLGPGFQAQLPEWTGLASESDPIWLGTQIWPSKNVNNKLLVERDSIGKGRQDSCGCQVPGSVECFRFHIAERRTKVKLELGFTFLEWNLDKVGEEVRRLWTQEEEKKFKDIVQSNPASTDRSFWDYIFRSFPTKTREDLVSYYFNVFLLQRRAYQNRHTPDDIDSDDDGSESGPMKNVFGHHAQNSLRSTLLSPKKPQAK
ncbi:hypothetical protein L6164_003905 [Bauhinia variegata]|uniref:Uncharacterized protein n=1 Tax=Bauhinia variegata TaxID=167791 RepID=A0ACB9Q8A6_BAUVA|nr:hypothetical protein L6164_003905 [Bauhinia variegata]